MAVPIESEKDGAVGFEAFYRSELDLQVRRAYLLTGSNEDANDVVHDAMVEVYHRWTALERPAAYLNTAVLNRCRDRARHVTVRDRSLTLIGRDEAVRHVDRSETVVIDEVLEGLPFNQRAAIVLRFYADMSTEEIAEALGCRPGSVGPWITRGLAALRKELS